MRLILTPYDLAVLRPPAVAAAPPVGGATPSLVGIGSFPHASAGLTQSVNAPPGVADDDVMLWIMTIDRTTSTLTMPSGWTLRNSLPVLDTLLNVYTKVASSEPSSYAFALSPSAFVSIAILAFRDVDTANPFDGALTTNTGASTTATATGLTTANDNAMLVMTATTTGTRNYTASTLTERYDDLANLGVFVDLQAVAGASGNKTATISSSASWGSHLIALRPSGGV